jgi:hypothetical protein
MVPFWARDVAEDAEAEESLRGICNGFSRAEEIWEGAKWLLARSPEIGEVLRGTNGIHVYKTPDWDVEGVVALVIVYTHDENRVVVHDVKARKEASSRDEL